MLWSFAKKKKMPWIFIKCYIYGDGLMFIAQKKDKYDGTIQPYKNFKD
jgi:hypothetical protein